MGITPEKAVEMAIDRSEKIGDVTKKNYKLQFSNLVRLAGGSATAVFRSPEKVYESMMAEYPSALTRRALLTVARSIIKLLPEISSKFPGASEKYAQLQKSDEGIAKEAARLMDGKLSERERTTYVPWGAIIEARSRLEREDPDSDQTLLLAMYTYIEPVRQDYGNVRIFYENGETDSDASNFLILDPEDRATAMLNISEYKTAKKYGVHRRHLPAELVSLIWASIDAKPREYLFVDSKGAPFEKKNSFAKWTNRTLENIFEGRRVTVNTLRHSYISSLDFNTKTPGDILRSAKMMGHSVNQQQLYRRLPSSDEDGTSSADKVRGGGSKMPAGKGKIIERTNESSHGIPMRPPAGDRTKHSNDAGALGRTSQAGYMENRQRGGIVVLPASSRKIATERVERPAGKWVERKTFVVNF